MSLCGPQTSPDAENDLSLHSFCPCFPRSLFSEIQANTDDRYMIVDSQKAHTATHVGIYTRFYRCSQHDPRFCKQLSKPIQCRVCRTHPGVLKLRQQPFQAQCYATKLNLLQILPCDDRAHHPRLTPAPPSAAPNCSSIFSNPHHPHHDFADCSNSASPHHGPGYFICGNCDNDTTREPLIADAVANMRRITPERQPPRWDAAAEFRRE